MQPRGHSKLLQSQLRILFFCSVLAISFTQSAYAQSPQVLSEIEQLYAGGNYAKAMAIINEQRIFDITNPNLSYMRANIYAALGETDKARGDYQWTLYFSKNPTIRQYCEQAITFLNQQETNARQAAEQAAEQAAKHIAKHTAIRMPPPAMSLLERQTQHEVRQTQKQASAIGQQIQAETTQYQMHHSAKTEAIVDNLQSAGFYDHNGDWNPAYSPADIRALQAQRQARETSVVNHFTQTGQDAQMASQQRSSAVFDTAEGLKSQMSTPVRPGEAILDPNSSNLFVRNYSQPDSAPSVSSNPKPATVTVP